MNILCWLGLHKWHHDDLFGHVTCARCGEKDIILIPWVDKKGGKR